MSNYNPNEPTILGPEFVPISDRIVTRDLGVEYGWGFSVTGLPGSQTDTAFFTLAENTPNIGPSGGTTSVAIYPRGREDDTGQIAVLTLTPSTISVTGATGSFDDLSTPGSTTAVTFDALTDRIRASFDVDDVEGINQAALQGKRILGIDLRYQVAGTPGFALEPTLEDFTVVWPYGATMTGPATLEQVPEPARMSLGEVNPWWNRTSPPTTEAERFPWRFEELERLDVGDPNRIFVGVRVDTLPLNGVVQLGYLALDIYYCEESRVKYGGLTGSNGSFFLRNTSFQVTGALAPGDYTATITRSDAGDYYNVANFRAWEMTQYQELTNHPAIKIEKFKRPTGGLPSLPPVSSPTDKVYGFIVGSSSVSHGYSEQLEFPIYINPSGTSVFARQQISNRAPISDTTYEYVRFYARRFNPLAPGNLTVSVSGTGSATITAEEFAALDELTIGDYGPGTGWRQVTLPITAVFSSDNSARNVTFTMTGVATGSPIDQYQLIGSVAVSPFFPYDSPTDRNLTAKMPFDQETAPSTTPARNVMVTFSQLSPTVTGFAVTGAGCALDVQQITTGCDDSSNCVPTHILGNRLAWDLNVVCDDFMRTSVNGWGTSTSGETWTATGGSASDYSVVDGKAFIAQPTTNTGRRVVIDGPLLDPDISATLYPQSVAQTASFFMGVQLRRDSVNNNEYVVEAEFTTTGAVGIRLRRNVAGTFTTLTSLTLPITYTADSVLRIRGRVVGSLLQGKVWLNGSPEPLNWQASVADTNVTAAGVVGVRAITSTTTAGAPTVAYGDFMSVPAELHNGSIEVQRMDEIDTDWQTIVDTEDLCLNSFCDYEARVGMTSWYRIRTLNSMDFTGLWVTGSAVLPSPAVSGVGDGNSVLIFTSNRAPESSLAYVMQFGNDPVEEFDFPEAGFQQLRTQYQKDFFTAFRPLERGGEAFTRDILVQNAAIPPESLANFRSLRDLAWATLPYVCVRDELGNRWFANVTVPSGRVRNNRTTYIAQIQVVEVTDTPAPYLGG